MRAWVLQVCPECGYAEVAESHRELSDDWCGHERSKFECVIVSDTIKGDDATTKTLSQT